MTTKKIRQGKIIELIRGGRVASQHDLVESLKKYGIQTTQATLSRDLSDLGIIKGRDGYEIAAAEPARNGDAERMRRVIREFVKFVDASGNIVVLKTDPGAASRLALDLDRAGWPEILGTIAGDDTVFVVIKRPALVRRVLKHIKEMLS
jgi:transcriptional regulator of arginine metabolism